MDVIRRKKDMLEQRLLDINEFRQIYEWHLVNHFPPDEVKPFYILEKCYEEGNYFPYGYFEEGRLAAYAYICKCGSNLLLDYLAVLEEMRRLGKGSEILALLKEGLSEGETLFIEVEQPDPEEPEIRAIQLKRIQFYIRNGAKGTGLVETGFGVPYRILTLGEGKYGKKARKGMEELYRYILSEEMYEKNIFFKLDSEK